MLKKIIIIIMIPVLCFSAVDYIASKARTINTSTVDFTIVPGENLIEVGQKLESQNW